MRRPMSGNISNSHLKTAMKGMKRMEEVQSTMERQKTRTKRARLRGWPATDTTSPQNWDRRNPEAVPTASSRQMHNLSGTRPLVAHFSRA